MDQMPDYSKYTLEQLYDVYHHVDREMYLDRFAVVVQEIEKRKSETKEKGEEREAKTSTSRWRKPLAFTEVVGGVFLLIGSILMIYSGGKDLLLLAIGAFGVSVIAMLAGIALYKDTPLGKKLSIFLQVLQLFSVSTTNVFYLVIAGLQLKLSLLYSADTLLEKGWNMSYGINGTFLISGPGHGQPLGIGVNFFALSALLLLVYKHGGSKERSDSSKNLGDIVT